MDNDEQLKREADDDLETPGKKPRREYRTKSTVKSDNVADHVADMTPHEKIQHFRKQLPIYAQKNVLLDSIEENDTIIVVGDTGSGKTTQLAQYILEERKRKGLEPVRIGITQPRRVGATAAAGRVAEEMQTRVGEKVGYSIRFDDRTSRETVVKYMTDGVLLRECLKDKDLKDYGVIILDEAHERSLFTDVLFAVMKQVVERRTAKGDYFKLIVTSATLEKEKFKAYFKCPIFDIPGRTFPVEILYSEITPPKYLQAAIDAVIQIQLYEPPDGDILVFLTGQDEIDQVCNQLRDHAHDIAESHPDLPLLDVLPLYSSLPSDQQKIVFQKARPGHRKVIISTNIAETSVTIDGIVYVVDPGFVKQKCYVPEKGMDALVVVPISRVEAHQRAGRAGRTQEGVCYRLYPKEHFDEDMKPIAVPEIQRTHLGNTVLALKVMGFSNLLDFDFVDKPAEEAMIDAMKQLYWLEALDEDGHITEHGKLMAEFPVEPQLSRMLLKSADLGCAVEIIRVVAMLSGENIFIKPPTREEHTKAIETHASFHHPRGDHLTFLRIYNGWLENRCSPQWCRRNYLHGRALRTVQSVEKQLTEIFGKLKLPLLSSENHPLPVARAVCGGLFLNAARSGAFSGYKTMFTNQFAHILPTSAVAENDPAPEWVVFNELISSSKPLMRNICVIQQDWVTPHEGRVLSNLDIDRLVGRKKEEQKAAEKPVAVKRNNEATISSARERYLARKKNLF